MLDRLDEAAVRRVAGPAWDGLRDVFMEASGHLLAVDPSTCGQLTTIYVKYSIRLNGPVYAVAWIKKSTELVVGFALPGDVEGLGLELPPCDKKYAGLTGYLTLIPGDDVPVGFSLWARNAYANVAQQISG